MSWQTCHNKHSVNISPFVSTFYFFGLQNLFLFQVGLQHDGLFRPVRSSPPDRLHGLRVDLSKAQSPASKSARLKQQVRKGLSREKTDFEIYFHILDFGLKKL